MGLFTPKWKDSRSGKDEAVNAVYRIKDQDTLKKAALSASWRQAKIAAINRITDENFLYDLAKAKEEHFEIKKAAVNAITSQKMLLELSMLNDETVAAAAIEKITDRDLLKKALTSSNVYVRHCALERIGDQELFKKYAVSDPDENNRIYAFDRIIDEECKKELMLKENKDSVLWQMFRRSMPCIAKDQKFCRALFDKVSQTKESFPESYPLVIHCLKDEEILFKLALNGETYAVRHAAARAIENDETIANLIMNADIEMAVKQDLYFKMKHRELVDTKMRKEIEYRDYRFWSEQDKHFADSMSADSY
ncbi:MAG: hypothetical protein IJD14_05550 [Christensenellaceae bacterium]|nr:hypothetical protein [Christensenellaceae bacterium]